MNWRGSCLVEGLILPKIKMYSFHSFLQNINVLKMSLFNCIYTWLLLYQQTMEARYHHWIINKKKLRIASYKVRIMIYERTCNSDFFFYKVYIWVYISQFWLFPQLRVKVQFWGDGGLICSHNCKFISYNSDFITLNCELFLSHNSEKIRIARYKLTIEYKLAIFPFFFSQLSLYHAILTLFLRIASLYLRIMTLTLITTF